MGTIYGTNAIRELLFGLEGGRNSSQPPSNWPCNQMPEVVANGRAHLPQYLADGGLAKCGLVRNQRYRDAMHEFEKCDHHFFFNSDRLSPAGLLALNVWPKVIHQSVESPPSHSQYIVEHVGGVNFKNVLLEPAR